MDGTTKNRDKTCCKVFCLVGCVSFLKFCYRGLDLRNQFLRHLYHSCSKTSDKRSTGANASYFYDADVRFSHTTPPPILDSRLVSEW